MPVDLWITSLLPTGPTGQAGDVWTTSLLPTNPQPYRKCDDRTARGAGRFGLGEHPAPISGKMAACTNHRYPEGGERDAAQDYPQSCPENQIVRVWCGSLGGGRRLPDSGSGTASSGQWPAGVFGLWAERPGVRQVAGPALRVRPVLGDEGVLGLCTATGGVYALRGTGGGDALGGGQTPGDPDLRLVSGELGRSVFPGRRWPRSSKAVGTWCSVRSRWRSLMVGSTWICRGSSLLASTRSPGAGAIDT